MYSFRGLALGAVCLACWGCTHTGGERRNYVVLVDYSGSMDELRMQKSARIIADEVLGSFRDKDALVVYPIDAGAVIQNTRLVDIDFRRQKFTRIGDGFTHGGDSVNARVAARVRELSDTVFSAILTARAERARYSRETDIIGAIQGVTRQFETRPEAPWWKSVSGAVFGGESAETRNVVVILSDMLHESSEADFAHHRLEPTYVEVLLGRLKADGKIPSMDGVVVFVVGRTGSDARQVNTVKTFWERYFQEARADLRSYDYEPDGHLREFLAERQ